MPCVVHGEIEGMETKRINSAVLLKLPPEGSGERKERGSGKYGESHQL